MPSTPETSPRAALIVAHPGHELRLHHWLERARPLVLIMTDGSGVEGQPRIASTFEVLRRTGAHVGDLTGRFSDVELYEAVMERRVDTIAGVTLQIARTLLDHDIAMVVTDTRDGYNPSHDLCSTMVELAVERASRVVRRKIPIYDYAVTGPSVPTGDRNEIVLRLDDAAVARKREAAYSYPEIRALVDEVTRTEGEETLKTEVLRPASKPDAAKKPHYETLGEKQVQAGRFKTVLRYDEHFAPFVAAVAAAVRATPLT